VSRVWGGTSSCYGAKDWNKETSQLEESHEHSEMEKRGVPRSTSL
jgi:hypothetical protein